MTNIKAIFFDFDGVMIIDKTGTISICNYISNNYPIDKRYLKKNIENIIMIYCMGK
jgi:histidinol phosphatase-like enzyme